MLRVIPLLLVLVSPIHSYDAVCATNCDITHASDDSCFQSTIAFFEKSIVESMRNYVNVQTRLQRIRSIYGEPVMTSDEIVQRTLNNMAKAPFRLGEDEVFGVDRARNVVTDLAKNAQAISQDLVLPPIDCPQGCEKSSTMWMGLFLASLALNLVMLVIAVAAVLYITSRNEKKARLLLKKSLEREKRKLTEKGRRPNLSDNSDDEGPSTTTKSTLDEKKWKKDEKRQANLLSLFLPISIMSAPVVDVPADETNKKVEPLEIIESTRTKAFAIAESGDRLGSVVQKAMEVLRTLVDGSDPDALETACEALATENKLVQQLDPNRDDKFRAGLYGLMTVVEIAFKHEAERERKYQANLKGVKQEVEKETEELASLCAVSESGVGMEVKEEVDEEMAEDSKKTPTLQKAKESVKPAAKKGGKAEAKKVEAKKVDLKKVKKEKEDGEEKAKGAAKRAADEEATPAPKRNRRSAGADKEAPSPMAADKQPKEEPKENEPKSAKKTPAGKGKQAGAQSITNFFSKKSDAKTKVDE